MNAATVTAESGRGLVVSSEKDTALWAEAGSVTEVAAPLSPTGVVGLGEIRGLYGGAVGGTGAEGVSENGSGVRGVSATGYGGYFCSDSYRGLYAANLSGTGYDAYFGGDVGIYVQGNVIAGGSKSGYVIDVMLNAGTEDLERGDLVEIVGVSDPVLGDIPVPMVRKVQQAGSRAVAGVVDREYVPGGDETAGYLANTAGVTAPGAYCGVVTLGAFAEAKADARLGPIAPGDLLVASSSPGYAKASDDPQVGSIVGKALGELETGHGSIPILVTLH